MARSRDISKVLSSSTAVALDSELALIQVSPASITVTGGTSSLSTNGTVTFTGSSSVSLNNFTSSSYDNYRVIMKTLGSVDGSSLRFRFRENTTDKATSYFGSGYYSRYQAGVGLYTNENNGTFCIPVSNDINEYSNASFDFYKSSSGATGTILGSSFDADATSTVHFGFWNYSMTNVTGFTIYPSSGNITGTVRVYGYRN